MPLEVSINTVQVGNWALLERGGVLYAPEEALVEWRIERNPAWQPLLTAGLWTYATLLPFVRAGMYYNQLRHRPLPIATAATTRWQVAAAPSVPDRFGGLGHTAFDLSLNRNRRGQSGRFIVSWDHHACAFLLLWGKDSGAQLFAVPGSPSSSVPSLLTQVHREITPER